MNFLPVIHYAREIMFESTDEEENVIEKVDEYAETTVPNMNSGQFKSHFRMDPEMLVGQGSRISRQNNPNPSNGGYPRTTIEKELLITIWCLGNLESFSTNINKLLFRSVADRFGITKSTCWNILYRTSHLLLEINRHHKIIQWPS